MKSFNFRDFVKPHLNEGFFSRLLGKDMKSGESFPSNWGQEGAEYYKQAYSKLANSGMSSDQAHKMAFDDTNAHLSARSRMNRWRGYNQPAPEKTYTSDLRTGSMPAKDLTGGI